MAPKSKSTGSKDRAQLEPPSSPGAAREAPDEEDDLEHMTPLEEAPEELDATATKKAAATKSTGKDKKKKNKKPTEQDGDEQVVEEEMVAAKKVSGKKRSKSSEEAPVQQEDDGEKDQEGQDEGQGEEEEEEENTDKIKRDRRGAKRTGYRNLAEQCGYDPKGESFKTDMQASAMTVMDVKRLVSFVPGTPEKPSFSFDEFERRMELFGESLPLGAARQALCHIEHAARHLIEQAVDITIAKGVQTISPAVMMQVLKPYRNSMEFSSIEAPVGLVRHAKSTPAQFRKEYDAHGKAKLVPSKETIIHPYEPNTDEKVRKDEVMAEFKETDKKMKAAEAKVVKKCLEHYNKRMHEVERKKEAKLAKRQKTAAA